jgi:hypothetical protein
MALHWGMHSIIRLVAALTLASGTVQAATVTVSPAAATVAPGASRQFKAAVSGAANTAVTWLVNGIPGGAPSLGLISSTGLYSAPVEPSAPRKVEVEAQSVAAPLARGTASVTPKPLTYIHPTFSVATTGSDANDGSAAHPWRTIQHAMNTAEGGSMIAVASGVYNEIVTVRHSGSAKGLTILTAAKGAHPIIDGTGLPIPNDEYGLVTLNTVSFVRVSGFEIRNYTSTSAALDPIGIYIVGAGGNIQILNNRIHDIRTTGKTDNFDALGIAVYGTAAPASLNRIVIDGNELDHLVTGFSESLALTGNVQYFEVTGNRIHDNDNIGIDVSGYEQMSPQAAYDRARNGYVAGNTVYSITSLHNPAYQGQESADGIYIEGGADVVVERNLVHDADLGIEVASEHAGRVSEAVTVRSNIVYASNQVGISIGGYAKAVGGTSRCIIVGNTLYGNGTAPNSEGEFQIQFNAAGNLFENNIAEADNAQNQLLYSFVRTPAHPATLNGNLYFSPGGANNSNWEWVGKAYSTFGRYQGATGNDAASHFADPKFVNFKRFDFHLAAGSPAIGAGATLPLSTIGLFDFAGKPRKSAQGTVDLGAYQD